MGGCGTHRDRDAAECAPFNAQKTGQGPKGRHNGVVGLRANPKNGGKMNRKPHATYICLFCRGNRRSDNKFDFNRAARLHTEDAKD